MVVVLALAGCGEIPDPLWLLTEEPRVLAFRTEVVEAGPLSQGFLPIPADRIRDQGLPGDTVEVSAWVVSSEGELEMSELEPAWFLCPPLGGCVSTLGFPGATEPCGDELPDRAACSLGEGPTALFTIPRLRKDVPLKDQDRLRVAMVGHVEDDVSTEACVGIVSDPAGDAWDGCIVGYHFMQLGPVPELYQLALDEGIEVPDPDASISLYASQIPLPHYNPEIVTLRLVPSFRDGRSDVTRRVEARPGERTRLDAGYVYELDDVFDDRDVQAYITMDGQGFVSPGLLPPSVNLYSGTRGVLESRPFELERLRAPEEPGVFSLHLVLSMNTGGAAWATFEFEVSE